MSAWEYRSDLVKPGSSPFVVLEEFGPDGWEAWHIEKLDDGWQEIYFKRRIDPNDPRRRISTTDLLDAMGRVRTDE